MLSHEIRGNLAKLLAAENIIVEHKNVQSACFDVVDRVLTLPMWDTASEDVYQMLILHEVGHAKYTPTEAWVENSKKYGSAINIIEDARIEKLIKNKYPGSKKTFHTAYKELADMNFFEIDGKDVSKYKFIDRINLYFKIGSYVNITFSEKERVIVDKITNITKFEEVISVCQEIVDHLLNEPDPEDLSTSQLTITMDLNCSSSYGSVDSNGSGSSNSSSSGGGASNQNNENVSNDSSQSEEESAGSNLPKPPEGQNSSNSSSESETGNSKPKEDNEVPKDSGKKSNDDLSEQLKSDTDNSFTEALKKLSTTNHQSVKYVELPELHMDKIIISNKSIHKDINLSRKKEELIFDTTKFSEFKESAKREVSYLVKEFECKKSADLYSRSRESKTGVLDCSKIFSYKYNENIFKSVTVVPEGKNHGLIFILDWSGSMCDCIMDTYKQLCCLIWFCKKVNIPFDVYAFTNGYLRNQYDNNRNDSYVVYKPEKNKLYINDFNLMNIISTKNKKISVDQQMSNIFHLIKNLRRLSRDTYKFGLAGTPLNESFVALNYIIPEFMKMNKVQKLQCVVLTDGDANPICYTSNLKGGGELIPNGSFLRDRKLKTTYKINYEGHYSKFTNMMLNYLSDKFEYCNFIGIRLTNHLSTFLSSQNVENKEKMICNKDWLQNQSCSITSSGYSKYFAIKTSNMNMNSDFNFENKSEAQIKNEFRRKLCKRTHNKKILSEFIDIIS